jgi:protein-L-isoaspartate(D-aspartate) O-methyltransferase
LLEQLAEGGRLVGPVGPHVEQQLVRIVRQGDRFPREMLCQVRFVPMIGRAQAEE